MIFDKIKKLLGDKSFYYEDVKEAFKSQDISKLKEMWENQSNYLNLFKDDESNSYGDVPTLKQIYATELTDSFTSNVVSGVDTFHLFKSLVDMGIKVYDVGLLDEDPYSTIEFMVGTDENKADEFDKYLDYVKDQIKEYDFSKLINEYNPKWFKEPFLKWLSNQDDMEELKLTFYEVTDYSGLLSKAAQDIFLF